ncbi:MAG: hypothetical protein ABIG71_00490 [Candidatus Uhrbacteria bacterium]
MTNPPKKQARRDTNPMRELWPTKTRDRPPERRAPAIAAKQQVREAGEKPVRSIPLRRAVQDLERVGILHKGETDYDPASCVGDAHGDRTPIRPSKTGDTILDGMRVVATCRRPYSVTPSKTIVVTCSEGQYSVEEDEVLVELGIHESPDRLVIPGGPGMLHVWSSSSYQGRQAALAHLKSLIAHHHTERVLLVMHCDCWHYNARFSGHNERQLMEQQLKDLREVAQQLHIEHSAVRFDCYIAHPIDGHVAMVEVVAK